MHVVQIEVSRTEAEALELVFEALGENPAVWVDWEAAVTRFEFFFDDPDAARDQAEAVERLMREAALPAAGSIQVVHLPDEDWQEAWKKHFHTEQVSERVVIAPTWEVAEAPPGGFVIRLDPGMSFGTGRHPTTQACLRYLDEIARERSEPGSACDVGCGSGILAIGAAKLGYRPVVAFDNDPVAVRIAGENLAANGVADVRARQDDLSNLQTSGSFDVVVANMLAGELDSFAPAIAGLLDGGPDSRLILAGLLNAQYEAIASRYAALGLREIMRRVDGEWTSGVLTRRDESCRCV